MKKLLISIVIMLLVYVSSMALEPVRVGLTYPSGLQNSNPKIEVDVFDYNGSGQKYPLAVGTKQDFGNIQANASGGAQIILGHDLVGEDDPDWVPLSVGIANNSTMVRVYVNGSIVTQLKLKDLIEAQQTTGDGDVIPSGLDAENGAITTGDPDDDLVVGGSSVEHESGVETKMFFENNKAAFRAGTVNGGAWDDTNLGQSSFATGENTIASGTHSTATGENTIASGDYSSASGEGTVARATYEVAVGSFNTDYTPAGDATDRAFSIGNGTGTGSRSDAFVVRKNGNTEITGKITIGSGATKYELPTTDGTANQILQTNGSGVLTFVDNVPGLGTANTWTALQTFEAGITIGDVGATTHYTLPTTRGTDKQILQSDASGVLTFVDNVPSLSIDSTLQGNGTAGTPFGVDLAETNTWTGEQTFTDAVISGNLTASNTLIDDGHLTTKQTTVPTIIPSGSVVSSTSVSTASDVAGKITLTTSGTPGTGGQVQFTFETAYDIAPMIILTPTNGNAASIQYFVTSTTTGFEVHFQNLPAASTVFDFNYFVIETNN